MNWDLRQIFSKAGIGVGLAEMAINAIAAKIDKELEEELIKARLDGVGDKQQIRGLRAQLEEAEIKIKKLEDDLEVAESRKSEAFRVLKARAEHAEWLLSKAAAENP